MLTKKAKYLCIEYNKYPSAPLSQANPHGVRESVSLQAIKPKFTIEKKMKNAAGKPGWVSRP